MSGEPSPAWVPGSGRNAQITRRDDSAELREELRLCLYNVIDSAIGRILRFNILKNHYGAIGTPTAKFQGHEFML